MVRASPHRKTCVAMAAASGVLFSASVAAAQANAIPDPFGSTKVPTSAFPTQPVQVAQVYNTPHYQSPVEGAPGDTLILPGHDMQVGAIVVYTQVSNPLASLSPPTGIPSSNSATEGRAQVLSSADVPRSLSVRLPSQMAPDTIYALWVKNPFAAYSEPVLINDPRPRWSTPALVYATANLGTLGRKIRVVGRNLANSQWYKFIRLSGPQTHYLLADASGGTRRDRHVVEASLPANLQPGSYQVDLWVDGVWYDIPDGQLEVRTDPLPSRDFSVASYGASCVPNDGLDDTACVRAAIDAAAANQGGTVFFPAGRWDLADSTQAREPEHHGLTLPPGVHMRGVPGSVVVKHPSWTNLAVFSLLGRQTIRNLRFEELVPAGQAPSRTVFLRLGHLPWTRLPSDPPIIEDVTIEQCHFEAMDEAVGSHGIPVRRLVLAHNHLEAYRYGLFFSGNPAFPQIAFEVTDSIIRHNRFEPGAYQDLSIRQGTLASAMGASRRMDMSDNVVDGRVNGGWRAGFFFHASANHEMLLLANNELSCTGSKGGDGEAIVFDENHNIMGFVGKETVRSASANVLFVDGALRENTPNFYLGKWVHVANGPGVGQSRKITGYGEFWGMTFVFVSPAFDVVPVAGQSEIVVNRAYHAAAYIENVVDNRDCPTAHTRGYEGVLGWSGMTIDSIMEGNRQYATGGVHIGTGFRPVGNAEGVGPAAILEYANEVRHGLIDGEPGGTHTGGIAVWYGSSRQPGVTLTHNLTIAHNVIDSALARNGPTIVGGAISTMQGWYVAQPDPIGPSRMVIHHNTIRNVPTGVLFDQSYVRRNVVVDNVFQNVGTPVSQVGIENLVLP